MHVNRRFSRKIVLFTLTESFKVIAVECSFVFRYLCIFPGDIAFRYLDGVLSDLHKEEVNENEISNDIVICDINKSMLEVGRRRAHILGIDKGELWT